MSCEVLEIQTGVLECSPVCRPNILEIISPGPQGIQGPSGSLTGLVQAEVPTGLINSINTIYTTAAVFTSIWVYLNGLRMNPGSDYNITDTDEITFTYAPTTGDTLIVDYIT